MNLLESKNLLSDILLIETFGLFCEKKKLPRQCFAFQHWPWKDDFGNLKDTQNYTFCCVVKDK